MRDREPRGRLEAAETGHPFSHLTLDASRHRPTRFSPERGEGLRTRLAQTFRFIVSQRLLPRADGEGRVAAIEILKSTARTRDYMERGESEGRSLTDAMDQGELEGMQTFDGVIERMIREGVVNKEEALHYASNSGNSNCAADFGGAPPGANGRPPAGDAQAGSMLDMLE